MLNRYITSQIEKYLDASKSILLLGPRQVGKSTLIENYLQSCKKNKTLIYRLQDIPTFQELILHPEMISSKAEKILESESLILYIDEVQKIPQLLDGCQYLIDKYKNKISVILTGSSARKLRAKDVNLLPGRVFVEYMHPLIIPEIFNTENQQILPIKVKGGNKLKISLEELLIHGSLPGVVTEQQEFKSKLLKSYVLNYLEEEIRIEALARNLGAFSKFLELSAHESGSAPNLSRLSQETGISVSTVQNYFQLLEDTLITFSIPPFQKKSRKQILSTPRYIFFDVGIRNEASRTHINEAVLKTETGGKLFEQFIILELIKRIKYAYPYYKYYFWRTKTGLEVDFIIQTEDELIPIEIKYTNTPRKEHIKHLKIFMEEYKKYGIKKGFLIGKFSGAMKLEDNIYAIPWNEL